MPGTRPGMTVRGWPSRSDAMNIQSSRYHEVHARSLADPDGFWAEAAREIDWIEPAKKVFDPSMGLYGRWFTGAVVNTCYNALDRHVANRRADHVALIHDSPLAGRVTKFTYAEMLHEVKTLAAIMADFGVAKGDRVILYMPLVPEAVVAVKWSMFNLYGVKPGEVWWCGSDIGWVVGHSYIIYGPLFHGATSIMYEGKPIGTPDAGAFWRVISEHKAAAFFTAPTAFRAIKKEDPDGKLIRQYDLSKFRTLFLAGERADPPTVEWAERQLQVPVIDHWWQTETGWCIAGNPMGLGQLPVKHGSPTVPMPGYQVDVVDEAAKPLPAGTMGSIVIELPLPPGCLPTLWEQDARCREAYFNEFPGYYKTSDAGYKDEDGYIYVMGRTDDIINVAGHRLSTGGMEEILAGHADVAECAVLGIKDAIKGEVPCGFLVLKAGVTRGQAEIEKEIVALVRDKLGPVAAFKLAITVGRLPKTRSGKILRGTIKKIADGDEWAMPATIEDPKVLEEIGEALKGRV